LNLFFMDNEMFMWDLGKRKKINHENKNMVHGNF
jgi:hypothetical protein